MNLEMESYQYMYVNNLTLALYTRIQKNFPKITDKVIYFYSWIS